MFESDRPDRYEEVYRGLVERLSAADLAAAVAGLGLEVRGGDVRVPVFGLPHLVGPDGVRVEAEGAAKLTARIVLAHYLLHGGRGEAEGRFVPYRELPGGMDFARNLARTVEGRIARRFEGRAAALRAAAGELSGLAVSTGAGEDAAFDLPALPRLPLRLAFYDVDEDFPADAKVFYDARALAFLDLECLAVLGTMLAEELEEAAARREGR